VRSPRYSVRGPMRLACLNGEVGCAVFDRHAIRYVAWFSVAKYTTPDDAHAAASAWALASLR
jgi:hypothetical protein